MATEIRVRAERKAGEMLAAMPKATGAKGVGPIAVTSDYRNNGAATLVARASGNGFHAQQNNDLQAEKPARSSG